MEERRLYVRTDLHERISLTVIGTYDQAPRMPLEVEITDISTDGIGFNCSEDISLNTFLTGVVELWNNYSMQIIIKVIRTRQLEDGFNYGCIFVGMDPADGLKIKISQLLQEAQEGQ